MKNAIIIIILTIIASNLLQYGYGQISQCGWETFQCSNGQCIPTELLCDGRADCADQSDETVAECNSTDITCDNYAFRCAYGGCIDGDKTCNGIRDCVDNSDETLPRCRDKNGSTTCSPSEFLCDNRQCIPGGSLCDGTADCADSSDETLVQCESIMCPQIYFRCNYGGCIDRNLKCNGVANCADGSDEDQRLCGHLIVTAAPATTSIAPNIWIPSLKQSCVTPPQPKNGSWKLHKSQCASGEQCEIPAGVQVEPGTYLVYACDPGYALKGSADVVCGPGHVWLNIPVCTEIRCRVLQSASTSAVCTYDDQDVSCQTPALPGTVARLTCHPGYHPHTSIFYKSVVTCNKTGWWTPGPIPCLPECGLVPPQGGTTLIVNGTQGKTSEFPWHATLYRAEKPGGPKQFICGATIIQNTLLVTAAHCVYNEVTKRLEDASKFFIATGNVYRDYDSPFHNSITVKKAKVKTMHILCNYGGLEGNYADDIAILEIAEPFVISSLTMPICLDINRDQIMLEPGIIGKVAGFGRTAVGASSFILQSIKVPYVPLSQCKLSSKPYETEKFITSDKFCAGYTNGTSVCDGDSGGGLAFNKGRMWYLQGIVSISLGARETGAGRICESSSFSLYTQVSRHMAWIMDVVLRLAVFKSYPSCPV